MKFSKKSHQIWLITMAVLAIVTGMYPAVFAFVPEARGLFSNKAEALITSSWYVPTFMVHIGFGAIAILAGSTQFFKRLRQRRLQLHRTLGKIYILAVIPSGLTGLIVGFYATGTWYSKAGFICLALGWLITTIIAYSSIKNGNILAHQKWMMRSYAFCFAFVTFRIYLGLGAALGLPFNAYYSYLSFLCWVPNIVFIEWRIQRLRAGLVPIT
ncbi:MAG: hypothetical protein CL867_04815 [Cytophagaceae bacterium]|nr:hypothetical protein [Cytophagaceae bacterium]|tara:strand:+ start:1041 stop:1679 length:639 start_codon:yes stop_codon:yes gene_type:complete